ncbi:MAG TPA: SufD family Fe-S cluster assembly protein [Candidatus Nanopelagicales bacterium]|nr:SufD family Fe-S cluster assembly protein [Candidatus Nanopelagicales bacterium]
MSRSTASASDLAPRSLSNDPEDHEIPSGREEEWRFTPIADIADFFEVQPWPSVGAEQTSFVSIRDGHAASSIEKAAGWQATDRPSAIARTYADQVVEIAIPAEHVSSEVIVVDLTGTRGGNYARVEINAGAFSQATIVLRHDMTTDTNGVLVTNVEDQADLTVLNMYDGPRTSRHLWQWATTVGRDARFLGLSITLGGAFVRLSPSVRYRGPGGSAQMLGAFLATDKQFQEFRLLVDHNEPHCTSNVVFKGALSGQDTHTVWIGDVLVRREAVGIETYEMNRNLLLDDGPRADSVPNLELETGDVVGAGHASATGRFDDEQLFYLQSRGIPEELARQLVVRGFFVEVLDKVSDEQLRADVLRRIEERIGMESWEVERAEVDA